jgi:ABC-type multidrug transport system ATPase subunit
MTILATLQPPDGGTFRLGDVDGVRHPAEIRRRLGYMPQEFGFDPRLSVRAVMEFLAALKGVGDERGAGAEVRRRLEQVELWELRDRKVKALSGGMKRRLGLAQALLGDPEVVLLDEPTAGLDPEQRERIMHVLADAAAESVLLVSSHIADDVRSLCPRVGILDAGTVRYDGTIGALVESLEGRLWEAPDADGAGIAAARVVRTRLEQGRRFVRVVAERPPTPAFRPATPVLEDAYRYVVGATTRRAA